MLLFFQCVFNDCESIFQFRLHITYRTFQASDIWSISGIRQPRLVVRTTFRENMLFPSYFLVVDSVLRQMVPARILILQYGPALLRFNRFLPNDTPRSSNNTITELPFTPNRVTRSSNGKRFSRLALLRLLLRICAIGYWIFN